MKISLLVSMASLTMAALSAHSAPVMPFFGDAPTGWVTDRYDPNSFQNVGPYQGRNDVLGIGISQADGLNNRPSGFQSTFYNTQGKKQAISGGAGSVLSAALYIPGAWANPSNGHVRTDMWGAMSGGPSLDYTIFGFTNYGGAARLRDWDDETPLGWVDILTAIVYDAWTDFAVEFTGSTYEYRLNGDLVYTDATINGSTGFSETIMQAYNFCGDSSLQGAVCSNYTAQWSNSVGAEVPTPGSLSLAALAMLALGGTSIRGRRTLTATA